MSRFIVPKFEKFSAYTPGEQPKISDIIKLNTNENPFPPHENSNEKVAEIAKNLNIYNDTECKKLTEVFTTYYGINQKNVIFANGSDEILAFCFLAFCDEKIGVCYPEISYGFYKVFSKLYSINDEKISLNDNFEIDISDYYEKNKTIIIANPNAPTGIALTIGQIEQILQKNPNNVVVIDEAYVDFGANSAIELVEKYENLLISGTFSKSRSLAGTRLGYAIANENLIDDLKKIKNSYNPYNVNTLTQALGVVSIEEDDYYRDCIKKIVETREKFVKKLDKLGFYTLNSKANFIFTKNDKISGKDLYDKLRERNIIVRHFDDVKISDFVRISIGTDVQMDKVILSIQEILEGIYA